MVASCRQPFTIACIDPELHTPNPAFGRDRVSTGSTGVSIWVQYKNSEGSVWIIHKKDGGAISSGAPGGFGKA